MPKIRQLWDFFVQAESSSYEKSSWCDLFLCQFIVDLNDGNSVDEILTFCNWSGVGTLIGCELLSDIDQVCSQPGDGEDLRPLKHHLFTRSWRALITLLSLGQQNFSCSNELANLLISLFPICLESKDNSTNLMPLENNKYLHLNTDYEVDSCFASSPLHIKFPGIHGQLSGRTEYFRSHSNVNGARSKRAIRGTDTQWRKETHSSESENLCDDFNIINKSCALKIKLDPMDFDYFTNIVRSDDDSRMDSVMYEPRRKTKQMKKVSPLDLLDEKIKDVMQSKVSAYEFSMLVIHLLTSLCRSEHCFTITTDNSYPVCLKSVKFALENLCSIQFGSISTQTLESWEAANLKSGLTQLLVISLEKVMSCPDVTTNVILTGILPMTLKVLEDSVCKLSSGAGSNGTNDDLIDRFEKEKQQQVIFGLICSVITFLFSLLMQNSEYDRVRNFLELFKIFIESNNGKLIEKTVIALARWGKTSRAKRVVDLIGHLILGLKNVRKNIVNPHSCKRFKHKKFKNGNESHHHHDLFGGIFTTPIVGTNSQQNCCVSSLFLVLMKLLRKPRDIPSDILNRILKVMNTCGTCCCFTSKNLLQYLSEIIRLPSLKSRILVFQLLENTLYPELGCYETGSRGTVSCLICSKAGSDDSNQKVDLGNENFTKCTGGKDFHKDLISVKSENSLPSLNSDNSLEGIHLGRPFIRLDSFQELLSSDDFRVVQGVTCHLLKCAPKMNQSAKYNILFQIFLPTFLSSKSQFFIERDDVCVFRILSSLSLFSSLLNNFSFAQQFINQKGLNHVLELISEPAFTRNCCVVLEKTIVITVLTMDPDIGSVPSLATLKTAVDRANTKFLNYFESPREILTMDVANIPMGIKKRIPVERKEREGSDKDVLVILENVSTFWRTYANLTLCSPILRKYFSQESFLVDCNKLLRISLLSLTNRKPGEREKSSRSRDGTEACLFTKLIESLLTFILATSDNEKNGDKNQVVVEELMQTLLKNDLRNFDVRRLAEVLLKCSLVQPSQFQVVPSDSAPKLVFAPFWTSCGDVSDVEESEEKLVSESESLDDNYVTADEGYEADVEIRDNINSPVELVNSNSLRSITDSVAVSSSYENDNEKYGHKIGHVIVYPELCLLAIDLLVKLFQERSAEFREKINCSKSKNISKIFIEKQRQENISKVKECNFNQNVSVIDNDVTFQKFFESYDLKSEKMHNENHTICRNLQGNYNDAEDKNLIGLVSIFQRLVSLCRDKPQNCIVLCKNNVILKLLLGFRAYLIEKKDHLSELQKSILDLITVLAKCSITPEELSIYFSFFKHDNPPLDLLINPLLSSVASYNPQPHYTLRFPVAIPHNFIQNSITDFGKNTHVQHKSEGVSSSWSLSAVSLPLGTELNWAVWAQGFSLSLWLKSERSNTKPPSHGSWSRHTCKPSRKISKAESHVSACSTALSGTSDVLSNENMQFSSPKPISPQDIVHVFSIGNDGLTLECWIEPDSDILLWRLTRIDIQGGYEILVERTVENCLSTSAWNFLAINVKDSIVRKKMVIEVTLIVNGSKEIHIPLSFTGMLIRRYRSSSLLVGAQGSDSKGGFLISSLMVFTIPVFTRERVVYLLGLGPNCTNLTDCQLGRRNPNFTWVFSMKSLTCEIDWEALLDAKRGIIQEVQSHLLIIYSAENPHTFNVYPSSSGAGTSSLFAGLRSVSMETRATQQTPVPLTPCIFAPLNQQKHQGLIPSAYILGGSATFMFLFARVVELSCSPDEQAKYLFLLLKFVQSDCDLFTQFVKNEHHNMLHKIFSVSKCLSGLHILKAILDACCDKSIIQHSGGKFHIIQQSDSIIVNSFLITTILTSWKDWNPILQENEVLRLLFSALLALLKDEHPYRQFNVAQLNRVQMVNGLLSFCKERLLYDDKKALTVEVCILLVELVKSLMGAPPEFSHIVAVMDCLILLHPANATYITHVKNSFYILLSAGQTFCSQEKNIELKSKNKNVERNNSKNGSYQFLDNWILNLNANTHLKKLENPTNFRSTVDPGKLNKALTNLQLKHSHALEVEKSDTLSNCQNNEELDSNKYSDDLTFDSGIAGSCGEPKENLDENEGVIVKAVDGSQQNLTSFFPGTFMGPEKKTNSSYAQTVEKIDGEEKFVNERERKEIKINENCGPQCAIVEGLLLLLRDIILVLPDSMAQQILNHVIKPEMLLVMANHRDHRIRSAVVKVLSSYLQRSSDEDVNKFIKFKGFYHLANQISLFPASRRLVQDCLQLLTRCSVSLDNHDFILFHEITYFGMACLPPLLALLPRSVHDFCLAQNLIRLIRQIYCKEESTSRVLLENGLLEILVKTLVASAHFSCEGDNETNQNMVLLDLLQFFILIVNKVLNTSGILNMQIVSDMRLELNYVMRLEKESCGSKSKCVQVIRDSLCKILEKALDILHHKIICLQEIHKSRSSSIFSSVLNGIQQQLPDPVRSGSFDLAEHYMNGFGSISSSLHSSNSTKEISRSELSERFKIAVVNAVEFLIYSEISEGSLMSQTELNFVYHLLPMLLQILSSNLEKRSLSRRPSYGGIYWAIRDVLKAQTFELIIWLMSPRQSVKTRMFAITTLMSQFNCKNLLSLLLQSPNQGEHKFVILLWDLMYNGKLASADLRSCQELKESIQQWGIISPHLIGNSHDSWGDRRNLLMSEGERQIASWEKQMEVATIRCITRYDVLAKTMSEDALTMTRLVVDAQNTERKSFMEEMKLRYSEYIHISVKWSELIGNLTHERAVWHFEKSYPIFWQLDPTEGPSRERRRLQRCHLEIEERYFLPSQRHKLNNEKNTEPLAFLFEEHRKNCTSLMLIERLHCNEKVRAMFSATIVTPASEIPGELLIGETCIYFVVDDKYKFQGKDIFNTAWAFEDVKEIHNRRFQLQERAIELFLVNGKTYFVVFDGSKERDALMAELAECDLPNRVAGDNLGDIMQLWREGLMTNWEYLTHLNKLSGRSYNDLMQYPVYPFILSDYTNSTLDLGNVSAYRNFKKPMAVQEKKNEQHYINNYNELLGGLKQVSVNREPYHYGSHYSNSGTVLHFLVRLPPFTKMLLQYQDRNFDLPDRTFHSLHTTWRLASSESTTDVKEMIPEFFFLPEFLTNGHGFNFGVRQNGELVNDVSLPPWAKGDPRRFILIHRQALESDYVTENLPHWIDLVFGFKQTGKAAVEAINVFHPATYCGFNLETIADPVEKVAWETMVKTYGQTPKQLLKTPHPLVIQSLVSGLNILNQVVEDVKGLKWGCYVGSPAEAEPVVVWRQQFKGKGIVAKLVSLTTNDVLGLPPCTTSLLQYNKEKGMGLVSSIGIRAALVSWGYSDGIIRVKVKKEMPLVPLTAVSQLDPVTICVSEPGCNHLWIGHSSGNITVYKFKFAPGRESIDFSELPVMLQGHKDPVTCITISRAYSIVVTAGQDGVLIIWDLNHTSYVRSLNLNSGHVKITAVSDTLGDIVAVAESADKGNASNVLFLHTINAVYVASISVRETITSVCFSTAPEGVSINVVACGLSNGTIRLFSSWDLIQLRDISIPSFTQSVVSLVFSHNSQLLYATFTDGTVAAWENASTKTAGKIPKFFNLKL